MINGLFGIVDADAEKSLDDLVDAYLGGGAHLLQLRMKQRPAREVIDYGRALLERCRTAGAKLIVNDRADIAAAIGADGVHLGQSDVPLAAARWLLPHGIIGRSTHDLRQVHLACSEGVDYIAFGPVFATRSKAGALAPVGTAKLAEAIKISTLPLVAIGGISIDNVRQVVGVGAKAVATISAVAAAWQPKDAVRSLIRAFKA